MSALSRTSPLHDVQMHHADRHLLLEQMPVVAAFDAGDAKRLAVAGVGDLCFKRRAGVKGPGAAAWLEALGIATPQRPNSWLRATCGSLVARLGMTEYAVVGAARSDTPARVAATPPAAGVYPVARFDADLVLSGRAVHDLLKQTCAFDFEGLDLAAHPLVMTSMVGVAVTLAGMQQDAGPAYRLWCDGTYGSYLWSTLIEVAASLGGGAVGIEALGALAH